jgi:hypothetical protein
MNWLINLRLKLLRKLLSSIQNRQIKLENQRQNLVTEILNLEQQTLTKSNLG